jgi:cysteine desulfurase / selenocysteine lyase
MKRKAFLRSAFGMAAMSALIPPLARSRVLPRAEMSWPAMETDSGAFWEFVRDQFPLTRERVYLNTGGLGASPYVVIDTVKAKIDELEKISETGHTEALWKEVKADAATLLGCLPEELAFTRNTTEGINIVANGLPFKKGDEVILTTHEHVGNALTWLGLAQRIGIVLKKFEPSTTSQQENLDRLARLVTSRTRLISMPHVVTTTGLVMPVKDIGRLAQQKKIWFLVDGAQTAGMFPFDLHDIGCDAYATSGHKWLLGPKETGLLYVRTQMLDTLEAKHIGAYSDGGYDFLKDQMKLNATAQRYEYGTVSIPLRAGLGAGIRFLQRIGMENVWRRDREMTTALYEGLTRIPGVKVLSPADASMRSAMVTFMHEQLPHLKLQEHLDTHNLRTRGVGEAGLAALRVSFHLYNSPADVERVLEGVRSATKQ